MKKIPYKHKDNKLPYFLEGLGSFIEYLILPNLYLYIIQDVKNEFKIFLKKSVSDHGPKYIVPLRDFFWLRILLQDKNAENVC